MQIKGIDVSHWQGDINWADVKNDGIEFAIIKAGGSDAGFYTDSKFEENYINAKAVGMPIGAYYFVGKDFKSKEDGIADAKRFLQIIEDKQFEYPVYVDIEITDPADEVVVTDSAIAFCEEMEKNGYFVGIYGSDLSTFDSRLELDRLSAFTKWVARYGSDPKYVEDYALWQYTSEGNVAGINGNVDMNYSNTDFATIIKDNGFNGYSIEYTPAPSKEEQALHKVGETVTFYEIYISSDSDNPMTPRRNRGEITSILAGARNPYLIDLNMGWINDNSIVSEERIYTVVAGDSLWEIANKMLGDGSRYKEIANLNGIENANKIYVGEVLRIPN